MEKDSEGPAFPWGTKGCGWVWRRRNCCLQLWIHQISEARSTNTAIEVALVKGSGSQNRKIYLQERDLLGRGGVKSGGREMKDDKGGSEQPRPPAVNNMVQA